MQSFCLSLPIDWDYSNTLRQCKSNEKMDRASAEGKMHMAKERLAKELQEVAESVVQEGHAQQLYLSQEVRGMRLRYSKEIICFYSMLWAELIRENWMQGSVMGRTHDKTTT